MKYVTNDSETKVFYDPNDYRTMIRYRLDFLHNTKIMRNRLQRYKFKINII